MNLPIYQILYQNRIETMFQQTTLEECTDVVYTSQQINEYFGVSSMNFMWSGSVTTDDVYVYDREGTQLVVLNLSQLMVEINRQLDKSKEANVDLSDRILVYLTQLNKNYFKLNGVMYRPSKGCFVKYKAPKKVMIVRKSIISNLRSITTNMVQNYIIHKYGFDFEFKCGADKKSQGSIVRFGIANGLTLEDILVRPLNGWIAGTSYNKNNVIDIKEFINRQLVSFKETEMLQATLDEFTKWIQDCIDGKDCPVENK